MTNLDEILRARQERIDRMHRFEPGRTALLVIHMQHGFLDPGAALDLALRSREIRYLAITGVVTDVCVNATLMSAARGPLTRWWRSWRTFETGWFIHEAARRDTKGHEEGKIEEERTGSEELPRQGDSGIGLDKRFGIPYSPTLFRVSGADPFAPRGAVSSCPGPW